jgi:hypothetical protein
MDVAVSPPNDIKLSGERSEPAAMKGYVPPSLGDARPGKLAYEVVDGIPKWREA